MTKTDIIKQYKREYTATNKPQVMVIGEANYLSICGIGDPSMPDYAARIQVLYAIAYTIKFECKKNNQDFVVSKLEGQWWFDEAKFPGLTISNAPQLVPRNEWNYRILIRMPEYVHEEMIREARHKFLQKTKNDLADEILLFRIPAGRAVQILHLGPFDTEPETLTVLGQFISGNELVKNGLHHEIYLSDFRKTKPEKLRTILREPIK